DESRRGRGRVPVDPIEAPVDARVVDPQVGKIARGVTGPAAEISHLHARLAQMPNDLVMAQRMPDLVGRMGKLKILSGKRHIINLDHPIVELPKSTLRLRIGGGDKLKVRPADAHPALPAPRRAVRYIVAARSSSGEWRNFIFNRSPLVA